MLCFCCVLQFGICFLLFFAFMKCFCYVLQFAFFFVFCILHLCYVSVWFCSSVSVFCLMFFFYVMFLLCFAVCCLCCVLSVSYVLFLLCFCGLLSILPSQWISRGKQFKPFGSPNFIFYPYSERTWGGEKLRGVVGLKRSKA